MTINSSGNQNPRSKRTLVPSTPRPRHVQTPIAVVGMACRLPGESDSPQKLWELLERGGVASNEAPESRFNLNAHHDGSKKPKTMRSPGGMFIETIDPKNFDANFFGISRTDADAMDPQQRQLLEVVYECLENAGISIESLDAAPVACFAGSYAVDYADMQARDPEDKAPSITIGVGRAILSNRISHFLNIKGPSMTIDTACSGSLVSVDVACRYLHTGEVDGAIIAGSNLYLSPEHVMDDGSMKGASSLTGRCHTFDIKADGYIKAEAVNAVYLKRLDDAIRDGDPIRAVIRGAATNSDGRTPGIASPSSEAQAAAIQAAYASAGISNLGETPYLECHGTGTQAGDPIEVSGAAKVFSPMRDPGKPLIIGSIKSNIGHSEPAAGISGLLKAILSLEKGIIPGNPTFITPNPKIDFEALKVQATRTAIPWPKGALRRASVNSFGYGGSNAHVVVEDLGCSRPGLPSSYVSSYLQTAESFFDDDEDESASAEKHHLLVFSANDESSLHAYFGRLRQHLLNPSVKIALPDLAYTLAERRSHHFCRGFVVTNSIAFDSSSFVHGKAATDPPKVAFIFTGQGAQWSQMGKELVETFSSAKLLLRQLDEALQSAALPPSWSIFQELTEPRSPEVLRQPEFSQPLVTALQIVIIEILRDWGIEPQCVVGHSSGEIAAAYTAGYITKENAIKAAYYRGQASKHFDISLKTPLGMMAVGLGPEEASKYITSSNVQIACLNSPDSVTLSGTIKELEETKLRLMQDKHFARLLQVNQAYHSKFMSEIGHFYQELMDKDFECESARATSNRPRMFSSVEGQLISELTDSEYWKRNMVSPVRFNAALEQMILQENPPDFLIEIGPSGALAGPVKQTLKGLGSKGASIRYTSALTRGSNAVKSTFSVAGLIHIAGGSVNFANINSDSCATVKTQPSVIVDLPNYAWNYSTQYWYENEASKDWRQRLFPHHDLLGTKILGNSWFSPSWRKTIRLGDLPWLVDHKLGPETVFPAAGYIALAMEAIKQRSEALAIAEGKDRIQEPTYKLRDVTFPKALVLEKDIGHRVMTTLTPSTASNNPWLAFKVSSLVDNIWNEHCRGHVQISEGDETGDTAPPEPLKHSVPGRLWYKAMHDIGYNFGPLFQKHLEVESELGSRSSRSLVDLTYPESKYQQSDYPMHPAAIDGCFQSCAPSLWNGNRPGISDVLVPAIIDSLTIKSTATPIEAGISTTDSRYVGLGRREETKCYLSNASVHDPASGKMLLQLSGLRYHRLDTREQVYAAHRYSQVVWEPDVTFMDQPQLSSIALGGSRSNQASAEDPVGVVIDLAAHKLPFLRVMEVNAIPGSTDSAWLSGYPGDRFIRSACSIYCYASTDAAALIEAQEKYTSHTNVQYGMVDDVMSNINTEEDKYDLLILRLQDCASEHELAMVRRIHRGLVPGGHLVTLRAKTLFQEQNAKGIATLDSTDRTMASRESLMNLLIETGFVNVREIMGKLQSGLDSAHIYVAKQEENVRSNKHLDIVRFRKPNTLSVKLEHSLKGLGWSVSCHQFPFDVVNLSGIVLMADELDGSILPTISEDHWEFLKTLTGSGRRILWLSKQSQLTVTSPDNAMIHGLARTVRAEDPSVSLTTLDLEDPHSPHTISAIQKVLETLIQPAPKKNAENEFVERSGIIYVSRIRPDFDINHAESNDANGAQPVVKSLQSSPATVRLQCERLGTVDSLRYAEVDSQELPLPDGCVEVDLAAAGLNFKDVAITMGIVPENQFLLGLEGAGLVRRVGKTAASSFHVGQRVLVFEKGTFANRIIATTERTYALPDYMSFEEASTLASVYLTAIYSIFDLAGTKKDDRVLIHSASGGLGIASIQLCKYLGAEVFATVGTAEKRDFLISEFGIPSHHIFSSRSTAFAAELMQATDGKGVNVILNSLTGDILDESWRCISEGGTMIELGKKDMLDRNALSMEPFGRNASYRCFDMSHKCVTDAVIARLLHQLFGLIEAGHVKPIAPIKTFGFDDIPSAFIYMRGANHIGKIVVTNHGRELDVPIRPAPRKFALDPDQSILIVGGLKGLCGSLALYLTTLGAKNLAIMARSGYDDKRSQDVLHSLHAQGCSVHLVKGDVARIEDVRRAFKSSPVPIYGVIQGAMVLRDKLFTSMTIKEYRDAVTCKVQGTWNLHNIALEQERDLKFFSMLSSVSGVVGQKGQANYAAANVFLDAFATYRKSLGLAANSVDLGAIEDVGYMHEHSELVVMLDKRAWTPINEALFHKIVRASIFQQLDPVNAESVQLITSVAVPQPADSTLLVDARFGGLVSSDSAQSRGADGGGAKDGFAKEILAFLLMLKSGNSDPAATLDRCVEIANKQFTSTLRLSEPMEPLKSLSSYGLDSLSAVEFRNWARLELGSDLSTLDITSAASLKGLCEKVISKIDIPAQQKS